jgi:flagellar L-ring protein precursor FlgH
MKTPFRWGSEMKTENSGNLKPEERMRQDRPFFLIGMHCSLFALLFLSACATPQLPPQPPKYVYQEEKMPAQTRNSLWRDSASLYEDVKARRLNDLVTIIVVENITGSGTADSKTNKDSSVNSTVDQLFGQSPSITVAGKTYTPNIKASMKEDFTGIGQTNRTGKLVGTITAKVVEVMPNGNLVLESRKEITINNEKQILILRGMIRPNDVTPDNTILSSKVADAEVFFVGKGIIQDKQSPGWLVQILDKVWPF